MQIKCAYLFETVKRLAFSTIHQRSNSMLVHHYARKQYNLQVSWYLGLTDIFDEAKVDFICGAFELYQHNNYDAMPIGITML